MKLLKTCFLAIIVMSLSACAAEVPVAPAGEHCWSVVNQFGVVHYHCQPDGGRIIYHEPVGPVYHQHCWINPIGRRVCN